MTHFSHCLTAFRNASCPVIARTAGQAVGKSGRYYDKDRFNLNCCNLRPLFGVVAIEDSVDEQSYERMTVYEPTPEPEHVSRFKVDWQNTEFRRTWLTWVSMIALVVLYPLMSVAFAEDPSVALRGLNDTMRMLMLLVTIVIQWALFVLLLLTVESERTGLAGLGFTRIPLTPFKGFVKQVGLYLAYAFAFLFAANLILSALAWLLAQVGLPMSGDIQFLIPTDPLGRVVWVGVSITAGVVEETAFRGYLMTRLRILGKFRSWVIPVIISSLVFGSLHAYQGLPGVIVIAVYGALFAALYIRTGTIWPAIIAHFFQDLSALFIPQ